MHSLHFSNSLIAALFVIVLCVAPVQADDLIEGQKEWTKATAELLYSNAHYPRDASKAGIEGRTVVEIFVGADGRIISASIHESSGYSILDDAALKTVNETGAFPPPIMRAGMERCRIRIPFNYALHGEVQSNSAPHRDLRRKGASIPRSH